MEETVELSEEAVLAALDENWITIITLYFRIKRRYCPQAGQDFSGPQVEAHLKNLRTDGLVEYYEEPDVLQETSLGKRQFYRLTTKGSKAREEKS